MKSKKIFLTLALLVVSLMFAQAQKVETENELNTNGEITNPDTVTPSVLSAGNIVIPSQSIYGNDWDTLYIRLSRHKKVSINDSIILSLLTSDNSNFYMPVPGMVLSEFGWRHGRVHAGIDLRLAKGDSVHSAFDGVVRISRYFSGYGNIVVVRHYNGLETCYAHLSKRIAKVNSEVKAGEVLGLGGRTGRATCDHLHFEVRYLEEPMNPRLVVDFQNQKISNDSLVVTNDSFFHRKTKSSKPKTTSPADFKMDKNGDFYTIKQGDTLYSIAKRNNTSVAALCNKNNLSEHSILSIGQKLKL
ncbi:MAG: peptidoglycan DD-metalloendopeptidase family protein [Bacteroidia bacterium]|nr:peptidoglycan DD-metalloendopeptidase family protein [Bacteroidia bacterium]